MSIKTMKESLKQLADVTVSSPKASWLAIAVTNMSNWFVEWGNPLISTGTSILGFILLIVLIRYHWENTKRIIKENK